MNRRHWLCAVPITLAALACSSPDEGTDRVVLVVPSGGDALAVRLEKSARFYLEKLSGRPPIVLTRKPGSLASLRSDLEAEGAGLAVVLDAILVSEAGPIILPKDPAQFRIRVLELGSWPSGLGGKGATVVLLGGASKLASQYALYELLRRLGARFYHPEQEYLPRNDPSQLRARARAATIVARLPEGTEGQDYIPDFSGRSYSFHASHPLEHQEAFSDPKHPIDEAVRVNEWIVKNRGNRFRGAGRGVVSAAELQQRAAELDDLRVLLGFPRSVGITLHNQQQGADAVVDPGSPVPPEKQIAAFVKAAFAAVPDAASFGIHFGPTEFTVTPDQETVAWIEAAGAAARQERPGIPVWINDHITGSQPTPNFGDQGCPPGTNDKGLGDYYDLALATKPDLGVTVHTVMFYPLEGPARVYNQKSFAHKLCLMQKASAAGRPLAWFPEGSWWLSFDNPVPVYLPLYILTRGRDIELVRPLLASRGTGSLKEHRMFNSGQEWGYWQQDYAVGLWHWNADLSVADVLAEMLDPLCAPTAWQSGCAARSEAAAILTEVMAAQRQLFLEAEDWKGLPGGLYAYFAGEDPADEIGAVTGFEFRPVRVAFTTVAKWNAKQVEHFKAGDLALLAKAEQDYAAWSERLRALTPKVPSAGRPWLDEIIDGVEIDGLRARQVRLLYEAVLAWREAQAAGQEPPAAKDLLAGAAAALDAAETVIRRRELAYRYPPAQMYGGGVTPETAVPNGTTYPWRVHTKTHLLSYWTSRHQQVADLFAGGGAAQAKTVSLRPGIAAPGTPLTIAWPALPGLSGSLQFGDGKSAAVGTKSHDYGGGEGLWQVEGGFESGGASLVVSGRVCRAARRAVSPPASLTLSEPDSAIAQSVLGLLFPSLEWAWLPVGVAGSKAEAGVLVLAADPAATGSVEAREVAALPLAGEASAAFATEPGAFELPIPDPATGAEVLRLRVSKAVLSGLWPAGGGFPQAVAIEARLAVADLVAALIQLAGYDEKGAHKTLAGVLGYDPAHPPETVPFAGTIEVESKR